MLPCEKLHVGETFASGEPDLKPVGFCMWGYLVMDFRHQCCLLFSNWYKDTKKMRKKEKGERRKEKGERRKEKGESASTSSATPAGSAHRRLTNRRLSRPR
jgi:hypothetical protein